MPDELHDTPTVLIVDDRKVNRELLTAVLKHRGYYFLEAADGAEAFELIREHRPDLVIADVLMPKLDGYGLLHKLRADEHLSGTPVIFYTAKYDEKEVRRLTHGAGLVCHLPKPSDPADILKAVDQMLASPRQAGLALPGTFDEEHVRLLTDRLAHEAEELEHEARLRHESEVRFRGTFENAAVGISHTDVHGRWLAANQKLCSILGYTHDELLQIDLARITCPADRDVETERYARLLKGELDSYSLERRYLRKNGEVVWVEATRSLQRDEAGKPWYAINVVQDVTDRKEAQEALCRAEELLAGIIDGTPDMIAAADLDLRLIAFNEAYRQGFRHIFGREVKVGSNLLEVLAHLPDERERAEVLWSRALKGERFTVTRDFGDPSRQRNVYELRFNPIRSREGKLIGASHIVRDVTARIRAEENLQESERRSRELANSMPQIVWSARPDGYVDYYNQKFYENLPAQPSHFGDVSWQRLIHREDLERVATLWDEAVRSTQPVQFEARVLTRSGKYRWHLIRAEPQRDEKGAVSRWYGTATDIDDQKQIEQALREAHQHKDAFLAMLGHELRNPLAPIRTAAHILRKAGSTEPSITRAGDMIERQVSHMSRLIDDLLDVTRISRGKIQLRKERLDVSAVIGAFAHDYQAGLEAADLQFEVCMPGGPLWISGDQARIQQIVGNLLHNAHKFTDAGGKVSLSLGVDGDHAQIIVEDTGIGLEADQLRRLFEPFHQAEASLDRSRGGLGLGLALVKGLTELHGGTVHAESAGLGRGARFTVRLPLNIKSAEEVQAPMQSAAAQHTHRILIIEDNPDAAESLQMFLTLLGHEVAVAYAGLDGLRKARDFQPGIALCDIGLPGGMDGYAVARQFRKDRNLKSVYLIAMTGYGQEEDRRRALEAGFDHHITKPADPEALERLLGT